MRIENVIEAEHRI